MSYCKLCAECLLISHPSVDLPLAGVQVVGHVLSTTGLTLHIPIPYERTDQVTTPCVLVTEVPE